MATAIPNLNSTAGALQQAATAMSLLSLVLTGAIFGFFFAWICSTIWGLNSIDPQIAIAAMQAMNASVRNAVFAPAFFGPTPVLLITAVLLWLTGSRRSGLYVLTAAGLYFSGAFVLTMSVNVPMNEALARIALPTDPAGARQIWSDYASEWEIYNILRTIASGAALVCVGLGLLRINRA